MLTKHIEVNIEYKRVAYINIIRYKHMFIESRYEKQQILGVSDIARICNISECDVINIVKNNFHGYLHYTQVYPRFVFKELRYAIEAKEWLESIFVMLKLEEQKYVR